MKKITSLLAFFLALVLSFSISGCGGGGSSPPPPPPAGTLNLTITDGSLDLLLDGSIDPLAYIDEANVLLLDGAGDPVNNFTSTDGIVTQANLTPGSYQLKVSAQGFNPSPAPRVPPLPVVIEDGKTTDVIITLFPVDQAIANTLGSITGIITDNASNTVAGALVIAEDATESYTTISAADGSYILHNVAEGSADLTAFISGLNFPTLIAVTVTVDAVTADQNIAAESEATSSISGSVNFVAGAPSYAVDVTLIDRETREVIPGMRVYINGNNDYTMSGLPDGNFEIIASLENDGIVIDPDEAVTQGDPLVNVTAGAVDPLAKDFKVTGAVEVDTPATPVDNIIPELTAIPTFMWHQASSYSSLNDYAIEVVNESGGTIWGGFDGDDPVQGNPLVTVAKGDNTDTDGNITIEYNSDGLGETLESGRYYQLRIYAMSDVTVSADYPQGFKLLSVTENLNGIFKVVE